MEWFLLAVDGAGIGIGLAIGLASGAVVALVIAKGLGLQTLGHARREADDILKRAETESQTLAKQIELDFNTLKSLTEIKQELTAQREGFEKEVAEERKDLKDQERRLTKREDTLSKKEEYLTGYDTKIKAREDQVQTRDAELKELIDRHKQIVTAAQAEQKQTLLRISNLSEDDARREAMKALERESQHEAAQIIQRNLEKAEEESKENALKITLQAIQRYASEHTADTTVSTVDIPSDDMKGRVIGREGRNIRAFEKTTGVDVIVDDTPGVIVVSCFDPVRRATAVEALKKLVDDGRIHPTRIEEVVKQMQDEMTQRVIKFGKDACIEANIQGLHPRLSEMMGRLHYRMSYGQNILRHSIEVGYLCQVIADELGLDGDTARRAGFLHDIGKAMDHDMEGGHPAIGMEFARKFGEKEAVLNAIGGHHNDIPATTPYTPIVMAADAISGARPGARRETLEKYVKRLQQLEEIATDLKGVRQAYAIQAGREVRVIVDPDTVNDGQCVYVARDIAKRVSEEMTFPGEIRVTVLREMRTVEYAR